MSNTNAVLFKGKKNGITIVIDEGAEFEEIKSVMALKVADAKKFFGSAKTSIVFQGRPLTETEEMELLNIISEKANLDISFVSDDSFAGEPAPREKPTPFVAPSSRLFLPEHTTKFHGSSLRSGQSIHFAGSVVVLGDVNAGAEVIAEGNIIVLGVVKGLVHAGCTGNTDCFVSAVSMMPTQLRIGDLISYIPHDGEKKAKAVKPVINPCYAYVKNGQIYIAPHVNS